MKNWLDMEDCEEDQRTIYEMLMTTKSQVNNGIRDEIVGSIGGWVWC